MASWMEFMKIKLFPAKMKIKYIFEDGLYNNCYNIYGIINPNDENECISCKNENTIYLENGCYINCSEIYGIINPKDENECFSWKNDNKI